MVEAFLRGLEVSRQREQALLETIASQHATACSEVCYYAARLQALQHGVYVHHRRPTDV